MNSISSWIEQSWGIPPGIQEKILFTLIVWIIVLLLRYLGFRIVNRNVQEPKERYYWNRAVQYTYWAIMFLSILFIWIGEFQSIGTFIGLVSAALTIALKDLIVNAAGWLFILIRKPFSIGDRVAVGDHTGDVIDVRIFQFTINEIGNWVDADQSTGRIIHIPNGVVFTTPQANFTEGFSHIWNEISVLITFESDWEKAKNILEEIVKEHAANLTDSAQKYLIEASKKYMILYSKLTPIVYTSVKDSGVNLTMRYLITPRRRRGSEQAIWEDVLRSFAKHDDIDLAYPTQRIVYHPQQSDNQ